MTELFGIFGDLLMVLVGVITLCVAAIIVLAKASAREAQLRERHRQRTDFWGYD
jgi:hypothetical protein